MACGSAAIVRALLPFTLLYFASFFALAGPLNAVPMFLAVARKVASGRQHTVIQHTAVMSFLALVIFIFTKRLLFGFFNVSAGKFHVTNKIVVFGVNFSVLRTHCAPVGLGSRRVGACTSSVSVAPLTVPVLYKPNTVTGTVILVRSSRAVRVGDILVKVVTLVCFVAFLVLHTSAQLIGILNRANGGMVVHLVKLVLVIVTIRYFIDKLEPVLIKVLGRKVV